MSSTSSSQRYVVDSVNPCTRCRIFNRRCLFDEATNEAIVRVTKEFASKPPKKKKDEYGREIEPPTPYLTPAQFASLVLHADLLDPGFTPHAVGVVFARARSPGQRKMSVAAFKRALAIIAAEKGCSLKDMTKAAVRAGAGRSVALAEARAKAASQFARRGGREGIGGGVTAGSIVTGGGGGGGGAEGGEGLMGQDDDATQSAQARKMSAMFHALDPEQKGWVSSIELFFLLDDSGAFERLPADVAAEELTAAGAPVNGSTRATAAVTLLDFVRYHEVLLSPLSAER